MAWSYGVELPVRRSTSNGYEMLKDLKSTIKQNFKMLVLTNPGERVLDPNYGVGMSTFLFEGFRVGVYDAISDKIRQQTARYMPAVRIIKIDFNDSNPDSNTLGVRIIYSVPQIGLKDFIEVTI